MTVLYWDASALAKRYTAEIGSATVNALLAVGKPHRQAGTHWTYTETYAVLKRRLNGGLISPATFQTAVLGLSTEVLKNTDFSLLSVPDWAVIHAVDLIRRHNFNATDAALLTLLLDRARAGSPNDPMWVLIASDQRLLRAAAAEGVHVLNPEVTTPADAVAFLASL